MNARSRRGAGHEQGTVTIWVSLLLVPLIVLAGIGVDVGQTALARAQLQNAIDAAALGAMGALRDTGSFAEARAVAAAIARAHRVAGVPLELDAAGVDFGVFAHDTRAFTPGAGVGGASAVRVRGSRSTGLTFARLLGRGQATVGSAAVATIATRDLVLVQDATGSFAEEIDDAQRAGHALLDRMADQGLAEDRFGLVEFEVESLVLHPISEVAEDLSTMHERIDSIRLCRPGPCAGTHIAPGLQDAIAMLSGGTSADSAKVIVLVSDGVPCAPNDTAETRRRQKAALDTAEAAGEAGISLFTVFLDSPTAGHCTGVSQGNPHLMQNLVQGFGRFYSTPDSEDLDDILVSIIGQMPIHLVR